MVNEQDKDNRNQRGVSGPPGAQGVQGIPMKLRLYHRTDEAGTACFHKSGTMKGILIAGWNGFVWVQWEGLGLRAPSTEEMNDIFVEDTSTPSKSSVIRQSVDGVIDHPCSPLE